MIRWDRCKRCGGIKNTKEDEYCGNCAKILRVRKKQIKQRENKKNE